MYLDSAYIAKYYLQEPDSPRVREALRGLEERVSSMWAIAEVVCAFHRHLRESQIGQHDFVDLKHEFLTDVDADVWHLIPVTDGLLRRVAAALGGAPAKLFLRSGDTLHLATAAACDEREIWSSDRHLLAAAPYFGLTGRSI